jgi:hypothetical protein
MFSCCCLALLAFWLWLLVSPVAAGEVWMRFLKQKGSDWLRAHLIPVKDKDNPWLF